jgi:hypothetical protein
VTTNPSLTTSWNTHHLFCLFIIQRTTAFTDDYNDGRIRRDESHDER